MDAQNSLPVFIFVFLQIRTTIGKCKIEEKTSFISPDCQDDHL